MRNTIEYKGYIGSVEFSQEDELFFGKVEGIRSLITYEGKNAKELLKDFKEAIDDYLDVCTLKGKKPEVAYKGSFNIRINPSLHKQIALYAINHNETLNHCIEKALEKSFN